MNMPRNEPSKIANNFILIVDIYMMDFTINLITINDENVMIGF